MAWLWIEMRWIINIHLMNVKDFGKRSCLYKHLKKIDDNNDDDDTTKVKLSQ